MGDHQVLEPVPVEVAARDADGLGEGADDLGGVVAVHVAAVRRGIGTGHPKIRGPRHLVRRHERDVLAPVPVEVGHAEEGNVVANENASGDLPLDVRIPEVEHSEEHEDGTADRGIAA